MQRDTKALRLAGWLFLAGIGTSAVGWLIDTMGYGVEAGIPYMVGIMLLIIVAPITLLMGLIDYLWPRRRSWLSDTVETPTREPKANWRRVISVLVAIPVGLIVIGWLGLRGILPEYPSGPADSQFLKIAAYHLMAFVLVVSIVYHTVLAIDLRKVYEWLREKQ